MVPVIGQIPSLWEVRCMVAQVVINYPLLLSVTHTERRKTRWTLAWIGKTLLSCVHTIFPLAFHFWSLPEGFQWDQHLYVPSSSNWTFERQKLFLLPIAQARHLCVCQMTTELPTQLVCPGPWQKGKTHQSLQASQAPQLPGTLDSSPSPCSACLYKLKAKLQTWNSEGNES